MPKFNFETETGETLSVEYSVRCNDRDGADAYADDVSLMRVDGTLFEADALSDNDARRFERKLQQLADDGACDAFTESLMDAADEYRDRMRDGDE